MSTREPKPKMTDRVNGWLYAFQYIRSLREPASADGTLYLSVVPVEPAAIAAAILTLGTVDLTDPVLGQLVELMREPQHEGEPHGDQP